MTLASVAPDVDGLGIIPELVTRNSSHPLLRFSEYHHSLHTLIFAIVVSSFAFIVSTQRWKCALLAFISFHLHLLEDLIGSRGSDGYQWPIPYLLPFSSRVRLVWDGQWMLNGWQNYVITFLLLAVTFWIARARGRSPVEMISPRADRRVVEAIRRRTCSVQQLRIDG